MTTIDKSSRFYILLAISLAAILAMFFVGPIAQDQNYHHFVDQRTIFGIANMWNVMSNLPFVIFGVYGLRETYATMHGDGRRPMIALFFIGLILTGFGSGYYHLNPNNETLVWDRLPMTLSFMAFFCLIIALHIDLRLARRLLLPLLLAGVASVLYWAWTEQAGRGDLRFYALVQFLPVLLIPLTMWLFRTTQYRRLFIWLTVLAYVAAKLAEHFDAGIYTLTGFSGHALKHLLAALPGLTVLGIRRSLTPGGLDPV